jgi:hypothetical protein
MMSWMSEWYINAAGCSNIVLCSALGVTDFEVSDMRNYAFYLPISRLFDDAVRRSEYTASTGTLSEQWNGKDLEGGNRDIELLRRDYLEGLRKWRKLLI